MPRLAISVSTSSSLHPPEPGFCLHHSTERCLIRSLVTYALLKPKDDSLSSSLTLSNVQHNGTLLLPENVLYLFTLLLNTELALSSTLIRITPSLLLSLMHYLISLDQTTQCWGVDCSLLSPLLDFFGIPPRDDLIKFTAFSGTICW